MPEYAALGLLHGMVSESEFCGWTLKQSRSNGVGGMNQRLKGCLFSGLSIKAFVVARKIPRTHMPADCIYFFVGEVETRLKQKNHRLLSMSYREYLVMNFVRLDFFKEPNLVAFFLTGELVKIGFAHTGVF